MKRLTWAACLLLSCVLVVGCETPPSVVDAPGAEGGLDAGADVPPGTDGGGVCTSESDCSDGVFCNGVERCMPGALGAGADGCVPPTPPCMPSQTCNEASDACETMCDVDADADDDGRRAMSCGGDDCDDADPNRFPGNGEVCDPDGHDEDCRDTTFGFADADMDGFVDAACCNDTASGRACGDDCNDVRPSVRPGAAEVCDEIDNDCDGGTDESVRMVFYVDADGDGFGLDDASMTMLACFRPSGYTDMPGDCNDDPAMDGDDIHPGAFDVCDGVIDHDCDGTVDNPPGGCSCTVGVDPPRPCALPGACSAATETCVSGGWDDAACRALRTDETCNGADDDCDGTTDDGVQVTCFVDADADRYAPITGLPVEVCPDPARPAVGGCPAGFTDRPPSGAGIDCDDMNRDISPAGTELCNGVNDDCDAAVDEMLRITCYADADSDAYAPPTTAMLVCPDAGRPTFGMCPLFFTNRAPGVGTTDCNDASSMISPGAVEVCDAFGTDEDCDMMVNEMVTVGCYPDVDVDGFAAAGATPAMLCPDMAGNCPVGFTRTVPGVGTTDCNDANPTVAPGRAEVCNLVDDNCNTTVDEGVQNRFYRDGDNDLFGDPTMSVMACTAPTGFVADNTDCNDGTPLIKPGLPELCNCIDDNCSGVADEGLTLGTVYRDMDVDGYGSPSVTAMRCAAACGGYVLNNTDCNDGNAAVHPGASDICGNMIDEDCSGTADLPLPVWYPDVDNDSYGADTGTVTACLPPMTGLWVSRGGDCRDSTGFSFVYPGAPEECDGLDTDCSTAAGMGEVPNAHGLNHPLEDNDGDSYGDATCVPPAAVATTVAPFILDCNDGASNAYPGAPELTGDGQDQSCNGQEVCFVDADNDGFRHTNVSLTVTSTDVDCADSGEGALAEPATDCNDANMSVNPSVSELADNGIDDNCSGAHGCFFDADNDGYSRSDAAIRDDSANASCADAGEGTNAEPRTDCLDTNAAVSPADPELPDNGLNDDCDAFYGCYFDADNDGYSRNDSAVRDDSPDNACTGSGEGTVGEPRTDCVDVNASINPAATDHPDNGIDDNCSGLHVCYHDTDSDGHRLTTFAEMSVDAACTGAGEGRSIEPADDCCDAENDAYPGQTMYFTVARSGCGGYDYNCDGSETKLYTTNKASCSVCSGAGWSTSLDPACGATGGYRTCEFDTEVRRCFETLDPLVQACR